MWVVVALAALCRAWRVVSVKASLCCVVAVHGLWSGGSYNIAKSTSVAAMKQQQSNGVEEAMSTAATDSQVSKCSSNHDGAATIQWCRGNNEYISHTQVSKCSSNEAATIQWCRGRMSSEYSNYRQPTQQMNQ